MLRTCIFTRSKNYKSIGTYFELLLPSSLNSKSVVPRKFSIDEKELKKNYHFYQFLYHPDHQQDHQQQKKQDSKFLENITSKEQFSTFINDAYSTLRNPIKRCEYILELIGESSTQDDIETDNEFLSVIMEIQEELELSSTQEQIYPTCKRVEDMMNESLVELEIHMDKFLSGQKTSSEMQAIHKQLNKLRYLQTIKTQCKELDCC